MDRIDDFRGPIQVKRLYDMSIFYKEQSNNGGIYVIFNKNKWKVYVGQTYRFKKRWESHLKSLRSNKHSNRHLQSDFNLCGEDAFDFHVLEVVDGDKKKRNERENFYLAIHHGQAYCYNFQKLGDALPRSCYSKNPEETKKKVRKGWHHSEEVKEKNRRKSLDQWARRREFGEFTFGPMNEERKKKIGDANRAKIDLDYVKLELFKGRTKTEIAKEIGVSRHTLSRRLKKESTKCLLHTT